jgi:hypothetical protein
MEKRSVSEEADAERVDSTKKGHYSHQNEQFNLIEPVRI